MPSYTAFVQRLNRLSDGLPDLVEQVLACCSRQGVLEHIRLVDSMPIVMAHAKRSSQAKVATAFANKGYCASKNLYFHGVKLHVVAQRRPGTLPLPEYIALAPGSANDLTMLRPIVEQLPAGELYGDKIYADAALERKLASEQELVLYTPVKKQKRQEQLPMTDWAFSEAVSRVRQPIESLFGWWEAKMGLEQAWRVRSWRGLLVHVFGRLAAALLLLAFYS